MTNNNLKIDLIYLAGNSNTSFLGIYDMKKDSLTKYTADNMEYYSIQSWLSDDNGITLKGINVKDQWGKTTEHDSTYAEFRIEYTNNTFTSPKFLKEYN